MKKYRILFIVLFQFCIIHFSCDQWLNNPNDSSRPEPVEWSGLADSPWPMHAHDPQHTSRSSFQGPGSGVVDWSIDLGGVVDGASPVLTRDTTVVVGLSWGNPGVFQYSLSGDLMASTTQTGRISSSPVIGANGVIYSGSNPLTALTSEMTTAWTTPLAATSKYAYPVPDALGEYLYMVSSAAVLKIHSQTGHIADSLLVPDSVHFGGMSPAFSPDGRQLYVTGTIFHSQESQWSFALFAFDTAGTYLWTYDAEVFAQSPLPSYPSVDQAGVVYWRLGENGGYGGGVYAVSADGNLLWKDESAGTGHIFNGVSIGPKGRLISVSSSGQVIAWDGNGHRLWEYDLDQLFIGEREDLNTGKYAENAPLIDKNGNIYIGMDALSRGDDSLFPHDTLNLAALNPDGTLKFALHVPNDGVLETYDIYTMPALGLDRRLYVATEAGMLSVIK